MDESRRAETAEHPCRGRDDIPLLLVKGLSVTFTQYDRGLRRKLLHPIKDLSLQVRRGEVTALAGASGSGKSLLAHAVLGILPYNAVCSGSMEYQGELLTEKKLKNLRGKKIVLIPQGVSGLDPLMKVGAQIRGGRKDRPSADRCRWLLERYGLPTETEELYPFELSGGMARRVLIAAAMMEEPELVIADEPTPGLDLQTARRVMGHFREMADQGTGVLLITHDLELAMETADRVLIFSEGSVIEELQMEAEPESGTRKLKGVPQNAYTKRLLSSVPGVGTPWSILAGERL